MNARGMSLVELTLAVAMLGILTLASVSFSKNSTNLFFQQVKGVSSNELHEHIFEQFEHDIKLSVRGKKIRWALTVRSINKDVIWVIITGTDEKGGRNAGATARFNRNSALGAFNSVSFQDDESNEIAGYGIYPDAILKDYDQDGDIDGVDQAKKEACLADFTTCVPAACMVSNRINLNDQNCLRQSVFPFFEFNENLDVLSLSLRPRRRVNSAETFVYQAPLTKAIYLYPDQEE